MLQSVGSMNVGDFDKFRCHSQAPERWLKLETEAATNVVGFNSRDDFRRTTLLLKISIQVYRENVISIKVRQGPFLITS